jgi:outer membrane protein assembly factor BamB
MNALQRRTLAIGLVAYAIGIVILIVHAYPRLITTGGGQDFRGRMPHPRPHRAIAGAVHADAHDAHAPATFEYRLDATRSGASKEPFVEVAPTPAWTFRPLNVGIHDASKASPAVDDSGVYIGADSSWFYALDLAGKLRWKLRVAEASRGVHGTAALDAQFAYIGAYNGSLYALRKSDGELAWTLRLGDTIGSSPVIADDSLYVSVETFSPPDGFVARVRRDTGEVVWLSEWLGDQSHSSPTIDERDGLVLAGANSSLFRAFRVDTGEEVWRVPTRGAVKDTGCLVDGIIYFTSLTGGLYAVRAADGHTVWETALSGHSRSSPTLADGVLIVGVDDGSVVGVTAASGKVAWRVETGFATMIASAVAVRASDGTSIAWMTCSAHELCAFRAATGEIVERIDLGDSATGVPTAFHGSLFVATDLLGGLLRFDPK